MSLVPFRDPELWGTPLRLSQGVLEQLGTKDWDYTRCLDSCQADEDGRVFHHIDCGFWTGLRL